MRFLDQAVDDFVGRQSDRSRVVEHVGDIIAHDQLNSTGVVKTHGTKPVDFLPAGHQLPLRAGATHVKAYVARRI